jgi:c-di-GMP-binding flagellar brake protein YcgR
MIEKRWAERWRPPADSKGVVLCDGEKMEVKMLNVSSSGMKAVFSKSVKMGSDVYAKLTIVESVNPFYVLGEIVRVDEQDGAWEASIKFQKVKTAPLIKGMEL